MFMKRLCVLSMACALSLLFTTALSRAQEGKKSSESKASGKEEIKGRLPIYFGQIGLSKKQEDEVRKAARPFDEKIADLKKQIEELEQQIDEMEAEKLMACEEVLSEGQKAALKARRQQAEAEKAARKKSPKTASDGAKEEKK